MIFRRPPFNCNWTQGGNMMRSDCGERRPNGLSTAQKLGWGESVSCVCFGGAELNFVYSSTFGATFSIALVFWLKCLCNLNVWKCLCWGCCFRLGNAKIVTVYSWEDGLVGSLLCATFTFWNHVFSAWGSVMFHGSHYSAFLLVTLEESTIARFDVS